MPRPTTANQCGLRMQVMLLTTPKEVVTVYCPRGDNHRGEHHFRLTWSPPRLAPAPPRR